MWKRVSRARAMRSGPGCHRGLGGGVDAAVMGGSRTVREGVRAARARAGCARDAAVQDDAT
ncbi:hypothetical protein GCM10023347_21750 [Streptomyces chumphonensis]